MIPTRYQRIQERAYFMWLQEPSGDHISFWFEAEKFEPVSIFDVPFDEWDNYVFTQLMCMISVRRGFISNLEWAFHDTFGMLTKNVDRGPLLSTPIRKIEWKSIIFPMPDFINQENADILKELAYKCWKLG